MVNKADVDTAYPQLSFNPKKVQWMTTRAPSGVVYISFRCNFGWGPMGFAFGVLARVIIACVAAIIFGLVRMYVDDIITITIRSHWKQDRLLVTKVLDGLMGDGADNLTKQGSTEEAPDGKREVVILGWSICLLTWTVDVAEYNRMKTLYTFWTLDLEEAIPVKTMQALCSLAQRYSLVYQELGVLMGDLWCMLGERRDRKRGVKLSSEAKKAIVLWRVYLVYSEVKLARGLTQGRCLDSFRKEQAKFVVEFDGSLRGVGIRVLAIEAEGERLVFNFGMETSNNLKSDSSYQNSMETISGVIGLLHASRFGAKDHTVHLRGDSKVALAWLSAGKSGFRSIYAQGALMAAVIVLEECNIVVDKETTLITSEENHICDSMSRLAAPTIDKLGGVPLCWGSVNGVSRRLADLCNPLNWPDSEEDILIRIRHIKLAVRALAGKESIAPARL